MEQLCLQRPGLPIEPYTNDRKEKHELRVHSLYYVLFKDGEFKRAVYSVLLLNNGCGG